MFIVSNVTAKMQTAIYVMAQFNQQTTCSGCPHTTGRARILWTPWHDSKMLQQGCLVKSRSLVRPLDKQSYQMTYQGNKRMRGKRNLTG